MSTKRYPAPLTCRRRISSRAAFSPDFASPLSIRKKTSVRLRACTAWTVIWSGCPGPMPTTSSSRICPVCRTTLSRVRILILGGTGEARALAAELVATGVDVLSSLAGRVRQPRLPDGPVRVGGFGGPAGLAAFLRAEQITAVIDATHPFAGAITANAAQAAAQAEVPLLVLRRPEWEAAPSWELVADIGGAAAAVRAWSGESVFLTTGRRDLGVFAVDDQHRFLVRAVDPPDGPVPPRMTLVLDRGPYTVEGELALMREHGVGLLVTKNSGGPMTAAKLQAARDLGVQVLMVRRPPLPEETVAVTTVVDAVRWISSDNGGA